MKIILSGATGAIGMAIIAECIKNNIELLILCRKDSSRRDRIPHNSLIKVVDCSLEEMKDLSSEAGNTYDAMIHLAWEGTFGTSRDDMYLQNKNVQYALDAVELAYRFGCQKFVGAGSQAEYGRCDKPLTAHTPTFPENGYGIAKLCAGQMTRIRAHQLGMKHIWMRIASIYGPYDGEKTLISSLIRSLNAGETLKCTKGEQMWDYLYSEDAARAFLSVILHGVDGKTYVLGSGQIRLLKEYIEAIKDILAPDRMIEYGAIPYGDRQVMFLGTDITELTEDCAWRPQYDFEEGIVKLIDSVG